MNLVIRCLRRWLPSYEHKTFEDISDRVFPVQQTSEQQHGSQDHLPTERLPTRLGDDEFESLFSRDTAGNAVINSAYCTENNRKYSPLLKLPGEIRNRIYGYAIGGHVLLSKYTVKGREYQELRGDEVAQSNYFHGKEVPVGDRHALYRLYCDHLGSSELKLVPSSTGDLLARTCRQLRHETGLLRYTLNTLQLETHEDIDNILHAYPSLATSLTHVVVPYCDMYQFGFMLMRVIEFGDEYLLQLMVSRFRFARAFQKLEGLKKVTLLNDWRDGTALSGFHREDMGLRVITPASAKLFIRALRGCIKKGLQVEFMLDRKNPAFGLLHPGTVIGGGMENEVVEKNRLPPHVSPSSLSRLLCRYYSV
ncbi:hypothetical protein P171DRAFT_445854 [Karstenula rhodostoma CBS 690.94]|uniref:Uncharacterized protein n=1 Tax=Karstenula rhodostoma CBS 690.94 TaxID=1392251 RepID=A0A9P4PDT3_9PLEO|nr:hypothetical protein P171DRAFT_445854 [Karstenula rhodostoma CBS 690.94]